ncbi:hypothetical protein DSO57_1002653 [Entomophthora muscae]|uniref:Uncharacterized protein n=1 Tax=Entomophthora muscae TaxID=34485 RepID=A0ACC2TJX8_9FUNG|nr:hypothetical protein DSO57_1002653 [Entomophthora muscae]
MFSTYSVLDIPTGNDVELFFKDLDGVRSKVACSNCRTSKRRCDRTFPSCSSCSSRRLECKYLREITKSSEPTLLNLTRMGKSQQGLFMKHRYSVPKRTPQKKASPVSPEWSLIVSQVLRNSLLDQSGMPVFMRGDGRVEYYGKSPVGVLLAAYLDLNPTKNQIQRALRQTPQQCGLVRQWIVEECVGAFFNCYSPHFPIIDEWLLARSKDSLLLKLVVGIGCRYLPQGAPLPGLTEHLDSEIFLQFRADFPRPTIAVAATLILIGQYQVVNSEFRRAWLYQSYYNLFVTIMGTHRTPPRGLGMPANLVRLRCHQWWGACIGDKLNTFLLNRPMLIAAGDFRLPYPAPIPLPALSQHPSSTESRLGREFVSSIYMRALAGLCDLMGHAVACLQRLFPQAPALAHERCQRLLIRFFSAYDSFRGEMNEAVRKQPLWLVQISQPLVVFNSMILHTVVIRLSQHFLRDPQHSQAYLHRSLLSAKAILEAAESLGDGFYRYGTVYRFYAVGSATLVFAHALRNTNTRANFPPSPRTLPRVCHSGLNPFEPLPPLPAHRQRIL